MQSDKTVQSLNTRSDCDWQVYGGTGESYATGSPGFRPQVPLLPGYPPQMVPFYRFPLPGQIPANTVLPGQCGQPFTGYTIAVLCAVPLAGYSPVYGVPHQMPGHVPMPPTQYPPTLGPPAVSASLNMTGPASPPNTAEGPDSQTNASSTTKSHNRRDPYTTKYATANQRMSSQNLEEKECPTDIQADAERKSLEEMYAKTVVPVVEESSDVKHYSSENSLLAMDKTSPQAAISAESPYDKLLREIFKSRYKPMLNQMITGTNKQKPQAELGKYHVKPKDHPIVPMRGTSHLLAPQNAIYNPSNMSPRLMRLYQENMPLDVQQQSLEDPRAVSSPAIVRATPTMNNNVAQIPSIHTPTVQVGTDNAITKVSRPSSSLVGMPADDASSQVGLNMASSGLTPVTAIPWSPVEWLPPMFSCDTSPARLSVPCTPSFPVKASAMISSPYTPNESISNASPLSIPSRFPRPSAQTVPPWVLPKLPERTHFGWPIPPHTAPLPILEKRGPFYDDEIPFDSQMLNKQKEGDKTMEEETRRKILRKTEPERESCKDQVDVIIENISEWEEYSNGMMITKKTKLDVFEEKTKDVKDTEDIPLAGDKESVQEVETVMHGETKMSHERLPESAATMLEESRLDQGLVQDDVSKECVELVDDSKWCVELGEDNEQFHEQASLVHNAEDKGLPDGNVEVHTANKDMVSRTNQDNDMDIVSDTGDNHGQTNTSHLDSAMSDKVENSQAKTNESHMNVEKFQLITEQPDLVTTHETYEDKGGKVVNELDKKLAEDCTEVLSEPHHNNDQLITIQQNNTVTYEDKGGKVLNELDKKLAEDCKEVLSEPHHNNDQLITIQQNNAVTNENGEGNWLCMQLTQ